MDSSHLSTFLLWNSFFRILVSLCVELARCSLDVAVAQARRGWHCWRRNGPGQDGAGMRWALFCVFLCMVESQAFTLIVHRTSTCHSGYESFTALSFLEVAVEQEKLVNCICNDLLSRVMVHLVLQARHGRSLRILVLSIAVVWRGVCWCFAQLQSFRIGCQSFMCGPRS